MTYNVKKNKHEKYKKKQFHLCPTEYLIKAKCFEHEKAYNVINQNLLII
jgi:hypothetical protein